MRTKTRLLLPAAVLAAAVVGTACVPPPAEPTPTTQAPPAPAGCSPAADGTPGPNTDSPIGSWGIDGVGYATAVIGDVAYVGGTFNNAVAPWGAPTARTNLAAFCMADGSLLSTFTANVNGPVNALTTDGTSLYVGGDFTALNGTPVNRLLKLDAKTGAQVPGFSAKTIADAVLDLDYENGVIYAAGDFGKIVGPAPGAGDDNEVGGAAGFDLNGGFTGWFAGADKKVEAIDAQGSSVFIGGNFATVKGQARDRLAKLDTAGTVSAVNFGALGARPFDLTSPDGNTLFVAVGPGPAQSGNGNRINSYAANGALSWSNNNLKGNGHAVELVGSTLYAGFLGGYDHGGTLSLQPAFYRLLTISGANQVGGFQPGINSAGPDSGVFDIAQGNGRFVVVGDFASIGSTGNLRGVAIYA